MNTTVPFDVIEAEFLKAWEEHGITQALEDHFSGLVKAKPLVDLETPEGHKELEILKHRFLCRGGGLLLPGPTGIGKSSLIMQLAVTWAIGRPCFAIEPAKPLKTLIVQAENDEGDMCEQRDGVFRGLDLTDADRKTAAENVFVFHENAKTGEDLIKRLKILLSERPYDLLVLDPANAYIGGDNSAQKDVGKFLRNLLNPVLTEFNIGCIIAHHTNKPMKGREKENWKAGDFAYSGSGSSEWANWARAILVLRSVGSHTTFQLMAAKRGGRLSWEDEDGSPTYSKMIAHHGEPKTICWRDARADEIPAEPGKENQKDVKICLEQKIANLWKNPDEKITEKEFKDRVKALGVARSLPAMWWKRGMEKGVFRKSDTTGDCVLTGKFKPMVSPEEEYERTSDRNFDGDGNPCDF